MEDRRRPTLVEAAAHSSSPASPPTSPPPLPCDRCEAPIAWERRDLGEAGIRYSEPWPVCPACVAAEAFAEDLGRRVDRSRLPPRFARRDWTGAVRQRPGESFDDLRRRAREGDRLVVPDFADRVASSLRDWTPSAGEGALLVGPVGSGKTSLLAATFLRALRSGVEGLFVSEEDLLGSVRSSARSGGESLVPAARTVPLLFLDDLGTVEGRKDWHGDIVESVVCARYNAELPILATSNLDPDALADRYGERVLSRLAEIARGRIFRLAGFDWRTGQEN